MSGLAETVGATTDITLAGRAYKIEKLTLGDWADFEQYAKDKHKANIIATAKEVYGDDIPDNVFEKATKPITEDELEEHQGTISGITFLLYKALVKRDPDITIAKIANMVTLDDIATITGAIMGKPAAKNEVEAEAKK